MKSSNRHHVIQQSSWRLAKDAPRELENAGTDTPRVFQGIDAIVLDEAHDCTAPMLDICACVLQRKQCSIDATGKLHFLGDNWLGQCEVLDKLGVVMQVSTANVVPDGQQRLLSTTNDVTIYIYIYLLFVLLILLLLLLLLLLLARARFSMIVGPWLAGARFSLIFS